MKKIRCFIAVLCAICSLISYGNLDAYATEKQQDVAGVALYKNGTVVGTFGDINNAFDSMTDQNADYEVKLYSDQTVVGHAYWPMVRSIKFSKAPECATTRATLYIVEDTAIQSNVCFSNEVALLLAPIQGTTICKNFYTQNYVFSTIDDAVNMGQSFVVGMEDSMTETAAGLNIIGTTAVFASDVAMYSSSLYVNYLEFKDTGVPMRGTYGVDISGASQKSVINTIKVSTPNSISILLIESDLKISNFTEDTTNFNIILHATNKNVEIENVHENCDLRISYPTKADMLNNTVMITGTQQPKSVTVALESQGDRVATNADAAVVYPTEIERYKMIYAPYVAAEKVKFLYTQQIGYDYTWDVGGWTYNGSAEGNDGYYYTSMPCVDVSNIVITTEGTINKEITYSIDTSKKELESVEWSWGWSFGDDVSKGLTWDNNKLNVSVTGLSVDGSYSLEGTFTYKDGSYYRIKIPVVVTTPIENIALNKSSVAIYFPLQTNYLNIADLTYTADANAKILVTTDNPDVLQNPRLVDGHIYATVGRPGAATLYVYAGDEVLTCKVYVNAEMTPTGWRLHEDGNWYYYRDNVIDYNLNGIAYNETEDEWWYAVNGKADFGYTGLTLYGDTWFYVESGVLNWNYTGLCEYYGTWYYVENGMLNWGYTGLTLYYGTWYYVENGILNWGYTGLVYYNGDWYYVANGMLNWGYTGLAYYADNWYYVANGVLNWGYTGLAYYADNWYYVANGVLNWGYTGLAYYAGDWYYVENGMLNWGYTGLTLYNGTWYYVEGGVLNWNYIGLTYYYGTWYYIGNGVLDWSFTGNVWYNGSWWYVENGVMVRAA